MPLTDAGVDPDDIAAVNAHAASTKVGDKVEYDALKAIFGDKLPPVSANKSLIGHAMGASSVIETIFALQGMQENILPPTINYTPDPEIDIDCVAEGKRSLNQEYILKNSFGFGGCNACAVFKKSEITNYEGTKEQKSFCGRLRCRHRARQHLCHNLARCSGRAGRFSQDDPVRDLKPQQCGGRNPRLGSKPVFHMSIAKRPRSGMPPMSFSPWKSAEKPLNMPGWK